MPSNIFDLLKNNKNAYLLVKNCILEEGVIVPGFSEKAASINDNYDISDPEREKQLIKLFLENGIDLTFED